MREFSKDVLLVSLFFTVLAFALGIWVGGYITEGKFYKTSSDIYALDDKINLALTLSSNPTLFCSVYSEYSGKLREERLKLGEKIDFLEKNNMLNDKTLKERYFNVELRNYLLLEKAKEMCNVSKGAGLYLYRKDCPECLSFGKALDALREKYGIDIYAFELSKDYLLPRALAKAFNISSTPAVYYEGRVFYSPRELERRLRYEG